MKILVCCADGMSSSLLVKKMREEIKQRELQEAIKIGSCAKIHIEKYLDEADLILIAPSIAYYQDWIVQIAKDHHSQVMTISMEDYGNLNAKNILDHILKDSKEDENLNMKLLEKIYPYAKVIASNPSLMAISRGFMSIMPVSMVGSLFILLKNIPIAFINRLLVQLQFKDLFAIANQSTLGLISVYLTFFITYHYLDDDHLPRHRVSMIAVICFVLISGGTKNGFNTYYFGTNGIISAILVGLVVSRLYLGIRKHISFSHQTGVIPSQVMVSLELVLPMFLIITFFLVIYCLISLTFYDNLTALIYTIIQEQLMKILANSLLSFVALNIITNLLWFLGIHGGNLVGSITSPIYTSLSLQNFAAYQQGKPLPNLINGAFTKCFTSGGAGSMFSLAIIMCLFSKSKQYKTLGKLALPTTLFFINEPLLFGVPIVLNPIFFVPLVFITPTLSVLTYIVMKIGIIPIPSGAQIPWTTPPIIYGLLQGSWKIALWELVMIILSGLMWYPFFKAADKQALKNES